MVQWRAVVNVNPAHFCTVTVDSQAVTQEAMPAAFGGKHILNGLALGPRVVPNHSGQNAVNGTSKCNLVCCLAFELRRGPHDWNRRCTRCQLRAKTSRKVLKDNAGTSAGLDLRTKHTQPTQHVSQRLSKILMHVDDNDVGGVGENTSHGGVLPIGKQAYSATL
jgi:hypothetical protein